MGVPGTNILAIWRFPNLVTMRSRINRGQVVFYRRLSQPNNLTTRPAVRFYPSKTVSYGLYRLKKTLEQNDTAERYITRSRC